MPVKLGHFSKHQKIYVIACVANRLRIKETVQFFQDVFPDFGAGLDRDVLEYKLARRVSDIKRKNSDEIEKYREVANRSVVHTIAHIPIAYREVRLRYLQKIYADVDFQEVHGENTVLQSSISTRLAILQEMGKHNKPLYLTETLDFLDFMI